MVNKLLITILATASLATACDKETSPLPTQASTPTPISTSTPTPVPDPTPSPTPRPFIPASTPVFGNGYTIKNVQRYSSGNVINLNKLEVQWFKNEKCRELNPKYGATTGRVVTDNVHGIVVDYPRDGVFVNGFEWAETEYFIPSDDFQSYVVWRQRQPFVRESTEDSETLRRMGQDIYDNTCNDPAQKTSLHQQLNLHMYGRNGVLRSQYAPKKLGL